MRNICMIILVLCSSILLSISMAKGTDETPEAVEKWFKKLPYKKEKVTKLRVFLHEKGNGNGINQTAYVVAQSNISSTSNSSFGFVSMIDDILREGAEPDSPIVGRAQGLMGSCSLEETTLIMSFTFVFTTGKYNGSSISILGRNPLPNEYRELPIVGGSGVFRLARGVITTRTIMFNVTSLYIIAEYELLVFHY